MRREVSKISPPSASANVGEAIKYFRNWAINFPRLSYLEAWINTCQWIMNKLNSNGVLLLFPMASLLMALGFLLNFLFLPPHANRNYYKSLKWHKRIEIISIQNFANLSFKQIWFMWAYGAVMLLRNASVPTLKRKDNNLTWMGKCLRGKALEITFQVCV